MSRGGPRPGAGRKKGSKQPIIKDRRFVRVRTDVRLPQWLMQKLMSRKESTNKNASRIIEAALIQYLKAVEPK